MKRRGIIIASLFTVLIGVGIAPAWAVDTPEATESGRLLAILLDSGRVVVGANQALINDATKGDKGFTPEVFEKQLTQKFKERASVDLANIKNEKVPEMAKKLLPQLVDASKSTVADAQEAINKPGVGFKGFIPATFGTQAAAKFSSKYNIYMKQTTVDELLRNPKNKADQYEAAVLKQFADPSYPRQGEKVVSEKVEGGSAVRVMLPLYYSKGCIACHGEPKGEKDISGYHKEGAKEGDLGGAISLKLPLK